MSILDSNLLMLMQPYFQLEHIELEGCFYPEKFIDSLDFAINTKALMCEEMGFESLPGSIKEKKQMEIDCSPIQFKY